ncbi:hypothetical protein [uncultured Ruegeria sp.]|uniref:hypothetical protein n=1 Tax=uncultured Ruegeria sp. TaxID=259304 RepID=UPI002617F4F3|nr:hypothetical protein [uncultured Ruegeria sp.]
MEITLKAIVFTVLSLCLNLFPQTVEAETTIEKTFLLSANWQSNSHDRKDLHRRSGADRDRVNKRDVGPGTSEARFDTDTRLLDGQIKSAARNVQAAIENGDVSASAKSLHMELTALSKSVSEYLDKHGSRLPSTAKADLEKSLSRLTTTIEGGYSAIQEAIMWIVQQSIGSLDAIIQEIRAFRGN